MAIRRDFEDVTVTGQHRSRKRIYLEAENFDCKTKFDVVSSSIVTADHGPRMSGASAGAPSRAKELEAMQARCSIQKRISALFVQEEEQESIFEQSEGAGDSESDLRRSAFIDEIIHVSKNFKN